MALSFAHGAIRWLAADAATTTYVVSGLSFQPKALRFYWVGLDSAGTDVNSEAVNSRRGVGFATSTSNRRAVGSFSQDTAATSNCGTVAADDCVACTTDGAAGRDAELDISAIASDGFTLIVDDQGVVDITVFWEAWGGTDIVSAQCGDIAEPAGTGDQSYAATGFVAGGIDQVVMFAGVQSIAAVNSAEAEASGLCVGFSSGVASNENIVVYGNADDASTAMDTDGRCFTGEVLCQCAKAGATTVTARAVLTAYGTDTFTLNWSAVNVTNRRSIYLAIKGGAWEAGAYTIEGQTGSATTTVTNKRVNPVGLCFIGRMTAVQSTNATTANDRLGFGTATSTSSRRSMGILDEDATASSVCEIDTTIQYDQSLCFPSTAGGLQSAYDINSFSATGFQIIVDTNGGVTAEWQGYLAFGSAYGTTGAEATLPLLVETSSVLPRVLIDSTDTLAVVVSDLDITVFELTGLSDPVPGLAETATQETLGSGEFAGSDLLAAGLTEDTTSLLTLSITDTLPAGLTDEAVVSIALAASDTLPAGMTEDAAVLVTVSVDETLAIGLAEEPLVQAGNTGEDAAALGLVETATQQEVGIIAIAAADSLTVVVGDLDILAYELTGLTDSLPGFAEATTLDTGAATEVTASEALTVGLTEAMDLAATLATEDTVPTGLTEAVTMVGSLSTLDTLPLGLTETADLVDLSAIPITASDTITTGLVETSGTILLAQTVTDALALGLTETPTGTSTGAASDTVPAGLSETATLVLSLIASDGVALTVTDTAATLIAVPTTDTLGTPITEATTSALTSSVADTLLGFAETANINDGTLVTLSTSDVFRVVVDDLDIKAIYLDNDPDPLAVGLAETATVDIAIFNVPTSDTLRAGLTEAVATTVNIATSDTVVAGLVEPYVTEHQVASSDTPKVGVNETTTLVDLLGGVTSITDDEIFKIGLTETATVFVLLSVADTLAQGLAETVTLEVSDQIFKTAADALPQLTEAVTLVASVSVEDTVPHLAEDVTTVVTVSTGDTLMGLADAANLIPIEVVTASDAIDNIFNVLLAENANIVDLTGGLTSINVSASLPIGLEELAEARALQPAEDTVPLGWTEAANVAVVVSSADTLVVQVTDDAGQGAYVLVQVEDGLPVGLVEDLTAYLLAHVDDTVGGLLSDVAQQLAVVLSDAEELVIGPAEQGLVADITDQVLVMASDTVRCGITEATAIETVTLLGQQLVVTTVEYLGRRGATLTSGPHTAGPTNMPKGAQLSEV